MAAVTKMSSAALPAPLTQGLERALRYQVARLDPPYEAWRTTYEVAQADLPSDEVRAALVNRLHSIETWMRPAGGAAATREYRMFCAAMAVPNVDEETAQLELSGFVEATADLPSFAMKAACQAFRLGKVGDGRWAPKGGEVRREALKLTYGMAKEQREIQAVLNAKPRIGWTGAAARKASIERGITDAAKARTISAPAGDPQHA